MNLTCSLLNLAPKFTSLQLSIFDVPSLVHFHGPSHAQPLRYAAGGVPTEYLLSIPHHPKSNHYSRSTPSTVLSCEELAEFFKTYDTLHAQILPQSDSDLDVLFAPPVVTSMYQSTAEATLPAPVPQAQIVLGPQSDPLTQMETGHLDTWTVLIPRTASN